jgi:5-formyltetrahydrofolate cyclo-ligase
MSTNKSSLRTRARERREALSPEQAERFSSEIHRHLLSVLDGTDPVLLYASKPPEVDTHPLIDRLLASGTRVVVPIIEREHRSLRLSYLADPSVLRESTFSVPEPVGHEIPADPREIGVAIVPMIAFDRAGHRLGYGAGYYDRFLSANPHVRTIGVAFSCQEIPSIPADRNDVSMDMVITEKGILVVDSRP